MQAAFLFPVLVAEDAPSDRRPAQASPYVTLTGFSLEPGLAFGSCWLTGEAGEMVSWEGLGEGRWPIGANLTGFVYLTNRW
jgi:hypothetical protein